MWIAEVGLFTVPGNSASDKHGIRKKVNDRFSFGSDDVSSGVGGCGVLMIYQSLAFDGVLQMRLDADGAEYIER